MRIFRPAGRTDRVLVTIFALVNLLVVANAILHDPRVGYDSVGHLQNIRALAEGRLPTRGESDEFFSPPLPYSIPALLLASGRVTLASAAKAGQLVNAVLSVGLTLYLLRLSQLLAPSDRHLGSLALALTGILPVFYKTFAMVRGEPYVAFLAMVSLYYGLRAFSGTPRIADALILGLSLGLALLSRQWAFFILPPLGLLALLRALRDPRSRASLARQMAAAVGVAAVVGGWFYVSLFARYGSVMTFNRPPAPHFALSNQPRSFYLGTGSGRLFSDPVRPSFPNQLLPTFYSETWGDYWAYFTIYGRRGTSGEWVFGDALESTLAAGRVRHLDTNRSALRAYLGRVNLISLFPTVLLAGAGITILLSAWRALHPARASLRDDGTLLLALFAVVSLAGYGCFLIRYPSLDKGDTIKASYALHLFPALAILAASPLAWLARRWPFSFWAILSAMGLVFAHNLPAMLTRFIP